MSVCIAVLCEGSKKIVAVTDTRASFEDFSADSAVVKNEPISAHCIALYAGNDVQYVDVILPTSKVNLLKIAKEHGRYPLPNEVASVVDKDYSELLARHIEKKYLRKHKFTAASFAKNGKRLCPPEFYLRTMEKIAKIDLSLKFLICGIDRQEERGRIIVVDGDGEPSSYDSLGFWAIGKGAPAALSAISFYVDSRGFGAHSSLEEAIYVAVTAKFMAESATDVGHKSTFLSILTGKDEEPVRYISTLGIDRIKKSWLKSGAPKIPHETTRLISRLIFTHMDDNPESRAAFMGKPEMRNKSDSE